MAKRLILHVGTPKSATSYLQHVLSLNRSSLAASGIHYADSNIFEVYRDFLQARNGSRERGAWRRLGDVVSQHDGDVLFSLEQLVMLRADDIARFLEPLAAQQVEVVVTARDLARVAPSQWQTGIKNGSTLPWGAYIEAVLDNVPKARSSTPPTGGRRGDLVEVSRRFWMKHHLPNLIMRWQESVPPDRIHVVTVPPSGSDPTEILRRFCTVLGTSCDQVSTTPSNESMGALSAELMRRMNATMANASQTVRKVAYRDVLGKLVLGQSAGEEPPIALTGEQFSSITDIASDMVGWLESAGVRYEGCLDDLVPVPTDTGGAVDPEASSDADLLAAALRGMVGLTLRFDQLWRMAGEPADVVRPESDCLDPVMRALALPRSSPARRTA